MDTTNPQPTVSTGKVRIYLNTKEGKTIISLLALAMLGLIVLLIIILTNSTPSTSQDSSNAQLNQNNVSYPSQNNVPTSNLSTNKTVTSDELGISITIPEGWTGAADYKPEFKQGGIFLQNNDLQILIQNQIQRGLPCTDDCSSYTVSKFYENNFISLVKYVSTYSQAPSNIYGYTKYYSKLTEQSNPQKLSLVDISVTFKDNSIKDLTTEQEEILKNIMGSLIFEFDNAETAIRNYNWDSQMQVNEYFHLGMNGNADFITCKSTYTFTGFDKVKLLSQAELSQIDISGLGDQSRTHGATKEEVQEGLINGNAKLFNVSGWDDCYVDENSPVTKAPVYGNFVVLNKNGTWQIVDGVPLLTRK